MSQEYSQRGIRGGAFGRGRLSHSRDLFKTDETRASDGPIWTPRNTTQSPVKGVHSFGHPRPVEGAFGPKHTRDLWKVEEAHSNEVPSVGIYNPKVGTRGPDRHPASAFATARNSSVGRDLWKAEEQCANEIPGVGLYTPKVTRRGPDRPRSAVVFGSARLSHSRDLWKAEEMHSTEMPGAGQVAYPPFCETMPNPTRGHAKALVTRALVHLNPSLLPISRTRRALALCHASAHLQRTTTSSRRPLPENLFAALLAHTHHPCATAAATAWM